MVKCMLVVALLVASPVQSQKQPDIDKMPVKELRELAKHQQVKIIALESKVSGQRGQLNMQQPAMLGPTPVCKAEVIEAVKITRKPEFALDDYPHAFRVAVKLTNISQFTITDMEVAALGSDGVQVASDRWLVTRDTVLLPSQSDIWTVQILSETSVLLATDFSLQIKSINSKETVAPSP